jgi:hypothetical protein
MGLLNGDLAGVFAAAFGPIYLDATLHRANTFTDDGSGGGTGSGFADGEPVKAQLESASQGMRAAEGYTDTDQRILVLASGVAPISVDDQITVAGTRWGIASVGRDPAHAYYDLHGRRA